MYDAGDHMKFGFPMAYTATVLSWSILEYGDKMKAVDMLESVKDSLKWITDYLRNAHASDDVLYVQPVRNVEYLPVRYPDSASNEYHIQNQIQLLSLQDGMHSVYHVQTGFSSNCYFTDSAVGPRSNRRSPRLPEVPVKVCHYFNKGFCKHGSNCRYFHGHMEPESFSRNVNLISHETGNEDQGLPPGSLEELKMELTELLKSRRGYPVSIASLPMLYYERYGKTLQADGYLTESQRHGKTGYSLTKLLARLKNCICVVDRPHGQHSVILAKDVPKYMEFIGDKNEHGGFIADSSQIYLTFPVEHIHRARCFQLLQFQSIVEFNGMQIMGKPCNAKKTRRKRRYS
ncbi:hypothetical protein POM88_049398 [Heracleum sosnowskyi]|uniref:cellulase n=1 Tax=Heracleum sosnowskyi TaxID=360622 RepID=A0AAD8GXN5_9APIA|nr:hypothetical protein POM88_049398 [Heracleum sosnowskyi]